jgi:hypothetical protein
MAVEPQPHPGALAGAAAGPAGRAIENPYAAAAAFSNAPGIGAGKSTRRHGMPCVRAMAGIATRCDRQRNAAAKRPRRMGLCSEVADDGGNLEDHHPPSRADTFAARQRFQFANRPANSSQTALNLFHSGSDKILAWDIASLGE